MDRPDSDHTLAPPGGLRRRLILGYSSQVAQLVVRTGQQILLVPLLIASWGVPVYSDWLVIFSAASLLAILELGVQTSLGNHLLSLWARRETEAFARTLRVLIGLCLFVVTLFAISAGILSFVVDWPGVIGADALRPRQTILTLLFLVIANLAQLGLTAINTIYRARGHLGRMVNIGTATLLFQTAALMTSVWLGASTSETAAVYALSAIIGWGVVILDHLRLFPGTNYMPALPTGEEMRMIAGRAPFYLMGTAANNVITNAPVLILEAFWGSSGAVVVFVTTRVLVGILRQLSHQMAHASGVEMARQFAAGDKEGLRKLFVGSSRFIGLVVGTLAGAFVVIVHPFYAIWTHGQVGFSSSVFGTLFVSVLLAVPGQVSFTMLYYSSRAKSVAVAYGTHALFFVFACLALVPPFGATGAALALAVTEFAVVAVALPFFTTRVIGVSFLRFMAATHIAVGSGFAASFLVAFAIAQFIPLTGLMNFLAFSSLWGLAACAGLFALVLTLAPDHLRRMLRRLRGT